MKPVWRGLKTLKNFAFKNSEVICSIAQATAFTMCIVETFKQTPKIMEDLQQMKDDLAICKDEEARKEVTWQGVKKVTKKAARPAMWAAVAYGMMVLSPIISGKKQAALAISYAMGEQALESYDKHIEEVVGKKKADEVRELVAKDTVEPFNGGGIVQTSHGDQLFFLMATGTWFRSSPDHIRLVFSQINERLNDYEQIDFNDALDDLGLERCKLADMVGWSARDGERAEVDLRNTGMYIDRVTGKEEAAIFVSTNETPLKNIYGDLDWHNRY